VDKNKWLCLVVKETEGCRTIEGSQEYMGLGEVVADVREGEQNKEQALISLEQKQMESEQEDWEMANRSQRKRRFASIVAARKSSRHQPTPQEPGTSQNNTNPFDILHSEYEILGGSQDEREGEIWGETDNLYTDGTVINSCDSDMLINLAEQCGIVMGGNAVEKAENITAMKLEELARAALANANYKLHNNRKIEGQHLLEGENVQLTKVDNSHRGFLQGAKTEKWGRKQKGDRLSRELKRISYK
jgi:hypothetical protein